MCNAHVTIDATNLALLLGTCAGEVDGPTEGAFGAYGLAD